MILLLGATGFLGTRVSLELMKRKIDFLSSSKSLGLDLANANDFDSFLADNRDIDVIINCAAYVGGISFGYKKPVEMLEINLSLLLNIYKISHKHGIKQIINPLSNCAFPEQEQIFSEDNLWNGSMHESVRSYGFSRRGMDIFSWAYKKQYGLNTLNLIFPNMYGPGDYFDVERSHAIGAFVRRFHDAKESNLHDVVLWGSGNPIREWIYVDDAAKLIADFVKSEVVHDNFVLGSSNGYSIRELAEIVAKVVDFKGSIFFDSSSPDGAKHKTMDSSKYVSLFGKYDYVKIEEGVERTYEYFKSREKF